MTSKKESSICDSDDFKISGSPNSITFIPKELLELNNCCSKILKKNVLEQLKLLNIYRPEELNNSRSKILKKDVLIQLKLLNIYRPEALKYVILEYFGMYCMKHYDHDCLSCKNACKDFLYKTQRNNAIDVLLQCPNGRYILQTFVCICTSIYI
jgi:hypothetical protein